MAKSKNLLKLIFFSRNIWRLKIVKKRVLDLQFIASYSLCVLPYGNTNSIMVLRLSRGSYTNLIRISVPILVSNEENKNTRTLMRFVQNSDKIILLRDFNARARKDWKTWNCLGSFGSVNVNDNSLILFEICTDFKLSISRKQLEHKGDHLPTWMRPRYNSACWSTSLSVSMTCKMLVMSFPCVAQGAGQTMPWLNRSCAWTLILLLGHVRDLNFPNVLMLLESTPQIHRTYCKTDMPQ